METSRRIVDLDREACLELLGSVEVGRVVFTDRALPAILPVTYVRDPGSIVIRTAPGSRLARAADGAVLAFEIDDVRTSHRDGWSVVVTGEAALETDPAERERLDGLLHAWVPGLKDVFIRIPLSVVTGRRVEPLPSVLPGRAPALAHRSAV